MGTTCMVTTCMENFPVPITVTGIPKIGDLTLPLIGGLTLPSGETPFDGLSLVPLLTKGGPTKVCLELGLG